MTDVSAIEQTTGELLDIHTIYLEPDVPDYPRGQQILERFAGAELIEVPSHWQIPGLHGNEGNVEDWLKIKRSSLVLGTKKSVTTEPNSRSSNFTAPSIANGCSLGCSYCYVSRRKGFANPITTFVNIEQISAHLRRHTARQGMKLTPDQADPNLWVYEIGTNSDCSVDAMVSDNVRDMVTLFRDLPNAKATFATKYVNRGLLDYDPQGRTRVRFSVMPQRIARLVDIRTSKIADRVGAINDFVRAGYEVHVNFAPVIYYDGWQADYAELMTMIDDTLSPEAKAQLKTEIIFLTHNDRMHEINMGWHPKGEDLLWTPDIQETKYSQTGGKNIRYKHGFKGRLVDELCAMVGRHLPYCEIRYAF